MKFEKLGRAALAAAVSLGTASAFTACGPVGTSNTADYVYVTNSKNNPGQINAYYLDHASGGLTQIPDSPYPSGGRNPVGLVTAPNFKNLYVINHDDNTIVQFGIGSDAKLYPQNTYTPPQTVTEPNAIAINAAGTLLFVTYTYQPGFTSFNPGPGAVMVYPITASGSLGVPIANGALSYYPLNTATPTVAEVLNPTAVNVAGSFLFVVSQNSTAGLGGVAAFSVGSGGALTGVPCTAITGDCSATGDGTFLAGSAPNSIASTPLGRYLYVTDSARNQLLSYAIQSTGQITPLLNGPIGTDVLPDAVTVDPTGQFLYVANYTANDIDAYSIIPAATSTSTSPGVAFVGSYGSGSGPTCVFVEPARGSYVYTTNFLDSTVSALNLSASTGALAQAQNTPFLTAGQPTCIAATPHGTNPPISAKN